MAIWDRSEIEEKKLIDLCNSFCIERGKELNKKEIDKLSSIISDIKIASMNYAEWCTNSD
jgi:hypothetical protein